MLSLLCSEGNNMASSYVTAKAPLRKDLLSAGEKIESKHALFY